MADKHMRRARKIADDCISFAGGNERLVNLIATALREVERETVEQCFKVACEQVGDYCPRTIISQMIK